MFCEPVIANEFFKKVVPLLENAKNTIDICVFDWRWYPHDPGNTVQQFNQCLVQAVRRGVKVRALVNSDNIAGQLRAVGVEVKKFISTHLLHCKLMIIDDKIVLTGSHNYTQSAFNANYELSVILDDVGPNSEFSKYFLRLWQSQ